MSTLSFSPSSKAANSSKTHLQGDQHTCTYKQFGHGRYSYELARDLLKFRDESGEKAHSFWAVFEASDDLSETEFQKCLWNELSYLMKHAEVTSNWEPQLCSDQEQNTLCFTLDGTTFTVTGLHPHSTSPRQRFLHPTMVFEIYENFQQGKRDGKYLAFEEGRSSHIPNLDFVLSSDEASDVDLFSGRENTSSWKNALGFALSTRRH